MQSRLARDDVCDVAVQLRAAAALSYKKLTAAATARPTATIVRILEHRSCHA